MNLKWQRCYGKEMGAWPAFEQRNWYQEILWKFQVNPLLRDLLNDLKNSQIQA